MGTEHYVYRVEIEHPRDRKRYRDEIAFLLDHPHPNIAHPITINEYKQYNITGGRTAVVVVHNPTVTLYDLLESGKIGTDPDLILSDIASAVSHLHQHPTSWHGYLSPEHIEIKDGRAIINDYGYYLTHNCYYFPNPTHCAPEVLALSQSPDRSVDSYAFGIIMIELYSARPAFYLEESREIAIKVMQGVLPTIPSNMPMEHAALCRRCISQNTTERPSMEEIKLYFQSLASQ